MRVRNLLGAFSAFGPGKRRLAAATTMTVIAAAFTLGVAPAASADTSSITFEPPTYSTGNINGQDGWSKTGPYDVAVANPSDFGSYPGFGTQSLRMSNYITSGGFGDQTFSKPLVDEAGETSADNGGMSGGIRQPTFNASFDFASTMSTLQTDMYMSVSPDRGDGARMSYLRFEDQGTGIHVFFNDYVDVAPFGAVGAEANGCGTGDNFTSTDIATISRGVHNIRFSMRFVNGPGNDVVNIYIDGAHIITGTSWEDYYRWCSESNPGYLNDYSRTVDSLLFREGGDEGVTHPDNNGKGFLVDNLNLTSGPVTLGACPVSVTGPNPTTYTLLASCTTDQTIHVPNTDAGGTTFNGGGNTITAVDPTGGHFLGAVLQADAGSGLMTVRNLIVTASGLNPNACDAGADRLRGILFDSVGGTIQDNYAIGIKQGASGCQEGSGIEVRNAPFTKGGLKVNVLISHNVVSDYQKTGILVNGSVAARLLTNTVTGAGHISYIAQNGVQIGYGATAKLVGNDGSGNYYDPPKVTACGLLLYKAGGVSGATKSGITYVIADNNFHDNEKNVCNYGKGGTFLPTS